MAGRARVKRTLPGSKPGVLIIWTTSPNLVELVGFLPTTVLLAQSIQNPNPILVPLKGVEPLHDGVLKPVPLPIGLRRHIQLCMVGDRGIAPRPHESKSSVLLSHPTPTFGNYGGKCRIRTHGTFIRLFSKQFHYNRSGNFPCAYVNFFDYYILRKFHIGIRICTACFRVNEFPCSWVYAPGLYFPCPFLCDRSDKEAGTYLVLVGPRPYSPITISR
jgi:hypothetical protein